MDTIVVHFSDGKLWGGSDRIEENIDAAESVKKFASLLEAKLKERYPRSSVRVVLSGQDRHTVDGRTDGYEAVAVGELLEKVRQSKEWVIRK